MLFNFKIFFGLLSIFEIQKNGEISAIYVLDLSTFSNYWGFIYKEVSPYVKKISSVIQQIKDSDISITELNQNFHSM